MQNIFDSMVQRYDAWFDRNQNAYLSEFYAFKKLIPRKGLGLEIGVGTGRFASLLGVKVGLDISVPMMKLASERGVLCVKGKAEELPFIDNTFDYVLITTSLCFFKYPNKALKEANRVLKIGGRIIIGFVDKNSFLGKKYKTKKSDFYKNAKFFSKNEIKKLLVSAGFKVTRQLSTINCDPSQMRSPQKPITMGRARAFIVLSATKR